MSKPPEPENSPSQSVVSLLQRQSLWHRHFGAADCIADRIFMPADSMAVRAAFHQSVVFHRITFFARV